MKQVDQAPLVVVVADTPEQRLALVEGLPPGAPVLLASDVTQARQVLAHLSRVREAPRPAAPPRPSESSPTPHQVPAHPKGQQGLVARRPGAGHLQLREDHLSLALGDREVALTRLEFALLGHLLPRSGQTVTFEELSQVGWGTAYLGSGAHMHAAIGRLRHKLAQLGAPVALEAVRGLGFRLVRQHAAAQPPLREAVGS